MALLYPTEEPAERSPVFVAGEEVFVAQTLHRRGNPIYTLDGTWPLAVSIILC